MERPSKCAATGKTRFSEPGEAKSSIIKLKNKKRFYTQEGSRVNRRQTKKKQARYYYCRHCHGFHITSHEAPTYKKKLEKIIQERVRQTDDLVLDVERGKEWKKDSAPFPTDSKNQ